MINARVTSPATGLTARLAAKARKLAEAHATTILRARQNDANRWRSARLLWPLFTKD